MAQPIEQPGPGRSTSEAAFRLLTKEIATKNGEAHAVARRIRSEKDHQDAVRRRREDPDSGR
jgi:hypothetical protein